MPTPHPQGTQPRLPPHRRPQSSPFPPRQTHTHAPLHPASTNQVLPLPWAPETPEGCSDSRSTVLLCAPASLCLTLHLWARDMGPTLGTWPIQNQPRVPSPRVARKTCLPTVPTASCLSRREAKFPDLATLPTPPTSSGPDTPPASIEPLPPASTKSWDGSLLSNNLSDTQNICSADTQAPCFWEAVMVPESPRQAPDAPTAFSSVCQVM